jgi:hypothetical protein
MPRYIGRTFDPRVHVIDANGDPVTGATVTVKILKPNGNVWDGTWNATHLSDGIYYTNFTPDEVGDWTVIFSCSNPKFSKAIVYHISYPVSFQFPKTGMNQVFPSDTNWYELFTAYSEDYTQRKLYMASFRQINNENAQKNLSFIFNMDAIRSMNLEGTFDSGVIYYLVLELTQEGDYTYFWTQNKSFLLQSYGQDDNGTQNMTTPLECRNFDIQVRIPSPGPGTNQEIRGWLAVTVDNSSQGGSYIGD